jgi:hypothetical protein
VQYPLGLKRVLFEGWDWEFDSRLGGFSSFLMHADFTMLFPRPRRLPKCLKDSNVESALSTKRLVTANAYDFFFNIIGNMLAMFPLSCAGCAAAQ